MAVTHALTKLASLRGAALAMVEGEPRRLGVMLGHLGASACAGVGVEAQADVCEDVVADVAEGVGTIVLNRPEALNALSGRMCREIERHIRAWASPSSGVRLAVVRASAGGRAFSAGGDVKDCSLDGRAGGEGPDAQFRAEYELMHWIRASPVPQVAFMDGITMGCGAGLAINGSYRVATERTVFAMPETSIGFFPDVGANWWLPRVTQPGAGLYVALTGNRLNASDLVHLGLATHYVASARLEALENSLRKLNSPQGASDELRVRVELILSEHASEPDLATSSLRANASLLQACFAAPSDVAGIVRALQQSAAAGSDWAAAALGTLRQKSPTSLKLIHEAMVRGATMSFDDVLRMEFRLAMAVFKMQVKGPREGDVYEGTRVVLVDKKGAAQWRPASLEEVDDASVLTMFAPPQGGRRELELICMR